MKKTIAIITVLFTTVAVSAPMRSMIAARSSINAQPEEKVYSAKDYVQDGLIALWDAEENVGFGEHETKPMVWKNLAGNGLDMKSRGDPLFYDKYIAPTNIAQLWYTDVTDLMNGVIENGRCTFEVVGKCVIGRDKPKMCLFGGGAADQCTHVTFTCPDVSRIGVCPVWNGNLYTGAIVGGDSPFAKISMYCDGSTETARYMSSKKRVSRTASINIPITKYLSKRFVIGYRYTVPNDSPSIYGEKVYSIRIYDHPLSEAEKSQNDMVDIKRFGL